MAVIDSPFVPKVFDLGWSRTPDGLLPYLAMELVKGATVAQLLDDDGPLGVAEAGAIAVQSLDALSAVHARGVVHRDVKPENIFLSYGNRGPFQVKLIDFGFSRMVWEGRIDRLTRAGYTVGTPLYMAPEQATADPRADHRVDLYAMALTLYEMLAGTLPFEGDETALMRDRAHGKLPPSVRRFRPQVSERLEAVITKGLARDPDERFADALSFKRVLLKALGQSSSRSRHRLSSVTRAARAANPVVSQ
jgi:serine/threonine-protein kinase